MKRVVPNVVLLLLILCPALPRAAAQGGAAVGGTVSDLHGTPQMGALVELLSADATVMAHTFTDDHGHYFLNAVSPGQYQLRASAAFLLPVLRTNLRLNPGVRAMANLTLTAMVEIGAWFPATKRAPDEPSDDWRWTLRSTPNRPLLRLAGDDTGPALSPESGKRATSAVEGTLAVSAGSGGFGDGGPHQILTIARSETAGRSELLRADLGDFSGAGEGSPMALTAGYQRQSVLGGDTRLVAGFESQPELETAGGSGLDSMTLGSSERMTLGDAVMVDAGTLLSAERLVATRVTAAPFVRIVVTPATGFALMYRYASGREVQSSDDLDDLQANPEILSDAEGQPVVVRDAHNELAATHKTDSDTETLSIYQDDLPTAIVEGGGSLGSDGLAGLPAIADASTGRIRIGVHGYTARGVSVSWTHTVNSALAASLAADLGSALVRGEAPLTVGNLNAGVRARVSPALSAMLHGAVRRTGTMYRVQYRWQPTDTLDSVDAFNAAPEQAYLSLCLRQRLWSGRRLQGVNAVVEASNLLEEGYQPMLGADGETLFLAQVPRTMQAGLSFSF